MTDTFYTWTPDSEFVAELLALGEATSPEHALALDAELRDTLQQFADEWDEMAETQETLHIHCEVIKDKVIYVTRMYGGGNNE